MEYSEYFHHQQHLFQEQFPADVPPSALAFPTAPHAPNNPIMLLSANANLETSLSFNQVTPLRLSQIEDKGFGDARSYSSPHSSNEVPPFPKFFCEPMYSPSSTAEEMLLLPSIAGDAKHVQQCDGYCSSFESTPRRLSVGVDARMSLDASNSFWGFQSMMANPNFTWANASTSLGLNLKTLDQLTFASNDIWKSNRSSLHRHLTFSEELVSSDYDRKVSPSAYLLSNKVSKTPLIKIGVKRTRRDSEHCSTDDESLESSQTTAKKSRSVSQTSCPMLKVRKEKLGNRISALHHLVAPFGKTDTASVLSEAIGYIQFLQDQIQTLTVPYMKRFGSRRSVQSGSLDDNAEAKQDLQSKGLCLMPLSSTSHIVNYGT